VWSNSLITANGFSAGNTATTNTGTHSINSVYTADAEL
jgi:hypothetical protein